MRQVRISALSPDPRSVVLGIGGGAETPALTLTWHLATCRRDEEEGGEEEEETGGFWGVSRDPHPDLQGPNSSEKSGTNGEKNHQDLKLWHRE